MGTGPDAGSRGAASERYQAELSADEDALKATAAAGKKAGTVPAARKPVARAPMPKADAEPVARPKAIAAPKAVAAPKPKAAAAVKPATKLVPPPDPMEALLLATFPISDADLATLAADRRSAVATAGGGIVAESDADDEVAETTTKFRTVLSALGVSL